jgi:hypothetical protein
MSGIGTTPKGTTMAIEEVPEPGAAPEAETGAAINPEERNQDVTEEAADFITSQVLDKDATFFGG